MVQNGGTGGRDKIEGKKRESDSRRRWDRGGVGAERAD